MNKKAEEGESGTNITILVLIILVILLGVALFYAIYRLQNKLPF